MSWRAPTETDLEKSISASEIKGYRAAAVNADPKLADPIASQLANGVALVRQYLRGGSVRMGPEGTIPDGLIGPCMDYVAVDIVKRLPIGVTEDRRKARDEAMRIFRDVQANPTMVEQYGSPEPVSSGAAVEVASSRPVRSGPDQMRGLL